MLKVSYPPQSGGHVQHHPFARGSGSYKLCQSVSGQYVAAYIAYILPNLPAAVRVDRADQGSTVYPPTCVAELRNKTMELGGSGATAFCLALGIMVFTGYYLKSVVRKPRIICKPKSFNRRPRSVGVTFDHTLSWEGHVETLCKKTQQPYHLATQNSTISYPGGVPTLL